MSDVSSRVQARVRPGTVSDAAKLPAIELAAAEVFPVEDIPEAMAREVMPVADFEAAARNDSLLVLADEDDEPLGFALFSREGSHLHLEEIDVHPDHARRGFGARLLEAVIDHARSLGCTAVSLTTFRHLPWNAPFYARHGFRILEPAELEAQLARRLEEEAASGLDPAKRVAMSLSIDPR